MSLRALEQTQLGETDRGLGRRPKIEGLDSSRMRLYAKRSRAIVQPNTEISHRSSNLFSAIEVAETIGTDLETINEWSASYSVRLLGCGCGASVASITRRSLAPWPSSGGDRTRPATNYAPVRVAPVAAAKVRLFSIQAGHHIGFCPFPTDVE